MAWLLRRYLCSTEYGEEKRLLFLTGSAVESLLFSHQQPLFGRWPVLGFAEVAGYGIAIERRGGENMAHI